MRPTRAAFTRALALVALGTVPRPLAAQPALPTLRIGTNAADDVTPLLWAQATGMFAKAGVNVDIQKFTSGAAVTAAVIGGALDVGRSSLLPLISARSHGVPVQLVAPGEISMGEDSTGAIIVLKDAPIQTGKDLNGKTIPSPALRDYFEVSTRAWIDAHGGDSSTVKFIEIPVASDLAALEEGRVAAAALPNPFLTDAIASGKVRVLGHPNTAIAPRFLVTAWCATESFIAQNTASLTKFAQALRQATVYANAHHAETVAITSRFWGLDPTMLANMPRTPTALALDPKDIQPLIDAALKYGVIERPMSAATMIAPLALRQ